MDILDSGLDGAFGFPDVNFVRKGNDIEVVTSLHVTEDRVHGLFSLWDKGERDERKFALHELERLFS